MAMPALAEKPLARSQSQTAVSLGICGIEYPDQAQKFFERFENFESGWHGGSTDAVAQVEPILAFGSWRLPWHGCWVSNAPTATSARQAHTATLLSGIFVDVHAQIAMAKMPRVSAPAVPGPPGVKAKTAGMIQPILRWHCFPGLGGAGALTGLVR